MRGKTNMMKFYRTLHTAMQVRWREALLVALLLVGVCGVSLYSDAKNIAMYRDTLSNSAPGEYSNHTVEFTVGTDIPAGGYIRIRPGEGDFTIPVTTFDTHLVELYVAPSVGSFVLRAASTTADASTDGIAIVYGANGEVQITLNSTTGITTGQRVKILLGTHTSTATTTDTGIRNPSTVGTQPVYIEIGGGTDEGDARALVAIVEHVGVGPVDTTETIPPYRFEGLPSGTLSGISNAVEMSINTDEFSRCRYSGASSTPFYSMSLEFTTTGSIYHRTTISNITPDTTYTFYVRCIDDENNYNIDDYIISFVISPLPDGDPGGGGGAGGAGSGSGGGAGGGSGAGSGGSSGGTTGSGGSRGGGPGGGGLNSESLPYESGDATVLVSGYAFPGSRVLIIVDGFIAANTTANANGSFSASVEAIARGVYSFGVYAIDKTNIKSTTFSTTFSVIGSRTSSLTNIHLMPTIVVSPDPVEPDAVATFSGYAIPNSQVTLETQQDKTGSTVKTLTATSDSSGRWSVTQSTQGFVKDKWKVRAKSDQSVGEISTNFSQYTYYSVGGVAAVGNNSDLNRDGKVNLIDFSILLFHWNTNGGSSNPPADINRDGKVSLTDFSIMVFNWTG